MLVLTQSCSWSWHPLHIIVTCKARQSPVIRSEGRYRVEYMRYTVFMLCCKRRAAYCIASDSSLWRLSVIASSQNRLMHPARPLCRFRQLVDHSVKTAYNFCNLVPICRPEPNVFYVWLRDSVRGLCCKVLGEGKRGREKGGGSTCPTCICRCK